MENIKPLVSVIIITYGHEKFIKKAIDGVFIQLTDFDLELIIADDSSPDKTELIVKKAIGCAPKNILVKYTRHTKNIGSMLNFKWAINQASAKYIAICDGDDFWTDPHKLQKQVDILEKNSDISISYHNCQVINEDGTPIRFVYSENYNKKTIDLIDLINGDYAKICTVVFRNSKNIDLERVIDDDTLSMEILRDGKVAHYVEDTMSVYQLHQGGIWSLKSAKERYLTSRLAEEFIFNLYFLDYPSQCMERKKKFYITNSYLLINEGFIKDSIKAYIRYIKLENNAIHMLNNGFKYIKKLIVRKFVYC